MTQITTLKWHPTPNTTESLTRLERVVNLRARAVEVTAAYTATGMDGLVLCDATSAAFTVTLPEVAKVRDHVLTVKKTDASANAITVDGNGSETIDGSANYSLASQNDAVTVRSDGTEWWVVATV